jgi:hypothetical protein
MVVRLRLVSVFMGSEEKVTDADTRRITMHLSAKTVKVATPLMSLLVTLLLLSGAASAQSGRAVMKGYVAFENVAYVDKQPRARVELCAGARGKNCGATTETDEHGLFAISPAPLGEWWLRISAPGFVTYEINIYLPSDFIGNLAVMLKRADNKKSSRKQAERGATLIPVGGGK